jgi:hypothetical protein
MLVFGFTGLVWSLIRTLTILCSFHLRYIQKTREIINGCRKPHGGGGGAGGVGSLFVGDLMGAVSKHGANRKMDSDM